MFYFLLTLNLCVFAGTHEHKSHEHGAGKVSIAFDGKKGKLTLDSSGDSIYGFEHLAKSKKDLQLQKVALEKIENNMSKMVGFDKKLNCVFKKEKMEIKQESGHSDVLAVFNIVCDQDPAESAMTFSFQEVFPSLKLVEVQLLVGDLQKSIMANKNGLQVVLKK